jgi:hypothetical protein
VQHLITAGASGKTARPNLDGDRFWSRSQQCGTRT